MAMPAKMRAQPGRIGKSKPAKPISVMMAPRIIEKNFFIRYCMLNAIDILD